MSDLEESKGVYERKDDIQIVGTATNGDEARYSDKSGTYSKAILQDGIGLVNRPAFQTFRHAINTGTFAAFEGVQLVGDTTNDATINHTPIFVGDGAIPAWNANDADRDARITAIVCAMKR